MHAYANRYFKDFDIQIEREPVILKHFLHIEADLTGLDEVAWAYLKSEVIPLFQKKNPVRGWQAAFDKLNEAKAYNYLKSIDCSDVRFIRVALSSDRRHPTSRGHRVRQISCVRSKR